VYRVSVAKGYADAHKYRDDPSEDYIYERIGYAIWLEIDERFDFEDSTRNGKYTAHIAD